MPDRVVTDPTLGHKLAFRNEPGEDGTEVTRIEMWVEPGGGVPAHVHPAVEETFTVLDGTAELLGGRTWRAAGPGETVVVPPGTRHAYRNRGDRVAHLVCIAKPASASLEEFLTEAAELSPGLSAGRTAEAARGGAARGGAGISPPRDGDDGFPAAPGAGPAPAVRAARAPGRRGAAWRGEGRSGLRVLQHQRDALARADAHAEDAVARPRAGAARSRA